ncbi:hypothetical protein FNW25_13870 [Flavobacterium franklandianum]|uniref:YhhN-like protein n=1 Tax=Flavobacterium franklandianum TaxID=2594430 RepID=A0A553CJ25_9FLAO|nr:hypothetical protein [Flavobacterium franklandianum]TRX20502.1 hypothetical protein FNW17_11650 [Flavobacterium franklandianum]TRX23255.1 hypothetical protein FNW25_13870 [Flavobacterium franklandianum]
MKILNNERNLKRLILVIYFAVAMVEIIAELFLYKPFLFVFKPLISIVLMVLYWNTSNQKNPLFFFAIFFSLITNMFFIYDTETMLFLGLIAFFIHRLLIIYYIIKLIELKDYIPLFIAMIPFLFFFFYLLSITTGLTTRSNGILIIQNILISIIAGITLSDFIMNNSKKNTTWFFIFGLLSITQYFIVFIEKYYLSDLSPISFRPLAIILNASVYFAFYKFVLAMERSNDN